MSEQVKAEVKASGCEPVDVQVQYRTYVDPFGANSWDGHGTTAAGASVWDAMQSPPPITLDLEDGRSGEILIVGFSLRSEGPEQFHFIGSGAWPAPTTGS